MAAKRRTLWLLALLLVLCASSAFASIPKPDIALQPGYEERLELFTEEPSSEIAWPVIDVATFEWLDEVSHVEIDLSNDEPLIGEVELFDANEDPSLFRVKEKLASGVLGSGAENNVSSISELVKKMGWGEDIHAYPFTEPANGKVYARARWYDPQTGTFMSPDPMGYQDSSNMYAFAGGDPVNGRDPTGLNSVADAGAQNECVPELVLNRAPFKPYLQKCDGSIAEVEEEQPAVDCSVHGCWSASSRGPAATMSAAQERRTSSRPYTQYGNAGDKAVATVQSVGNFINGFDNVVRFVYQGPSGQIESYFEPQSELQARTQQKIEVAAAVLTSYQLGVGGIRALRGRTTARAPIKAASVEADYTQNSRGTYFDSNPTARAPQFRTPEKVKGFSAPNATVSGMHAEMGAMYQAYEAGVRGGVGQLNVDVSPCSFCMNDIKAMARKLGLNRLVVVDYQTMTEYEFFGSELNTVRKGGKRWKDAKRR